MRTKAVEQISHKRAGAVTSGLVSVIRLVTADITAGGPSEPMYGLATNAENVQNSCSG